MIGQLGGSSGEIDLAMMQAKRVTFYAAGLRARTLDEKAAIVAATQRFIDPLVATGELRPIVGDVLRLSEAAKAHEIMAAGGHIGKVLLLP